MRYACVCVCVCRWAGGCYWQRAVLLTVMKQRLSLSPFLPPFLTVPSRIASHLRMHNIAAESIHRYNVDCVVLVYVLCLLTC